jgi:hypothetical protein
MGFTSAAPSSNLRDSRVLALRSSWLVGAQQPRFHSTITGKARMCKVLPAPGSRASSSGEHTGALQPDYAKPHQVRRRGKPAPCDQRLTVLTKKLEIKVSPTKLRPIATLVSDSLLLLLRLSLFSVLLVIAEAYRNSDVSFGDFVSH